MSAEKPFQAMDKDELIVALQKFVSGSVKYHETKLSEERKKVLEYYNGLQPKPVHAGNSKYVSLDVFDAVESMKAELLETFAAGRNIVSFDPTTATTVEQARIQSAYCDYVVFSQNDGFSVFSDVIQDGLMARAGIAKVYWDEKQEEVEEEFNNLSADELEALQSNPDYEVVEVEVDEITGLYSGCVKTSMDKSQVRIEVLPPEEFLIDATATRLKDVPCGQRSKKTRSALIKMGFDPRKVAAIPADEGGDLSTSSETLSRFESISSGHPQSEFSTQSQNEQVVVYEIYLDLDLEGTGETKLYKCTYAGNQLLDEPEEASERPFVEFVPLPIPHSFYGSNYAAKVIPTQNARTVLTRSILDHTLITNNPRYMVVKGALSNPREMLENRLGGLVNVTRPDGLVPLPQASLNPFVFQTIQLLDEDKEETTGISKLSQGMNKDAISKQNSAGMVEQLVSMSQKRQKIIARNFANQFIKQLYLMVYRLVNANEKGEKVIKVAGGFMRTSPTDWEERTEATVELKLGYNAQEMEAQKYLGLHAALTQDPTMGRMYGEAQKFKLLTDGYEKAGIVNIKEYIADPQTLPPPQPDPQMMFDMQMQQKSLEIQQAQVDVGRMKVEMQAQAEAMKAHVQEMKNQMEEMRKTHELALKTFEVHSRVALDEKELEITAKQPPESTKAILSPSY